MQKRASGTGEENKTRVPFFFCRLEGFGGESVDGGRGRDKRGKWWRWWWLIVLKNAKKKLRREIRFLGSRAV